MKLDVIYNKSCLWMGELPNESIDMTMTSPPYWGLRDYGEDVKEIWGGDSDCEHKWEDTTYVRNNDQTASSKQRSNKGSVGRDEPVQNAFCSKCNAWHGQLGLEPTFQLYLDHMMIVCAETKRVLKKTGSFWLNMGDTYYSDCTVRKAGKDAFLRKGDSNYNEYLRSTVSAGVSKTHRRNFSQRELQSKCLIGIPWRLVLRLIDEQGWVLRNAGIWNKPNSMPSSTKDRLSNSYEFLFHFVKNLKSQYCWNEKTALMADGKPPKEKQKEGIDWCWIEDEAGKRKKRTYWHSLGYWYDLDAIREPYTEPLNRWGGPKTKETDRSKGDQFAVQERPGRERRPHGAGKNPGDVWNIPTQPRPEAHFATFPDKLCIKPILATCPQEICKKCGKARVRITKSKFTAHTGKTQSEYKKGTSANRLALLRQAAREMGSEYANERETIGWTDCGCNAGWDSGVLLDPFAGRGTALIMAKKLGRHYVGYELKREYADMVERELEKIDPLFKGCH